MNFKEFLSKYEQQIYAVLRIVTGFLFLWHGSQKILGIPPSSHQSSPLVTYVAGPIELFGGLLVMMGLWTRLAAFLSSGLMAYAYWSVHGSHAILPILNGGEEAVIYCFLFLYITVRGAGIFSIDRLIKKEE